jgi:hypothetical protein
VRFFRLTLRLLSDVLWIPDGAGDGAAGAGAGAAGAGAAGAVPVPRRFLTFFRVLPGLGFYIFFT